MSTVNNDRTALDPTAGTMAGVDARNKSAMAETEDRFLTMLITQLRNQDPLNPMDNAQVTTQMAQMSTVAGIQQLNNTLLAVAGQMDVSQSMQAANLIGKQVLVPGSKVSLGTSQDGEKVACPTALIWSAERLRPWFRSRIAAAKWFVNTIWAPKTRACTRWSGTAWITMVHRWPTVRTPSVSWPVMTARPSQPAH